MINKYFPFLASHPSEGAVHIVSPLVCSSADKYIEGHNCGSRRKNESPRQLLTKVPRQQLREVPGALSSYGIRDLPIDFMCEYKRRIIRILYVLFVYLLPKSNILSYNEDALLYFPKFYTTVKTRNQLQKALEAPKRYEYKKNTLAKKAQ